VSSPAARSFAVICLVASLAGAGALAAAPALELVEVHSQDLPAQLAGARDVRWDGDEEILLSARGAGVVRLSYRQGRLGEPAVLVPEKDGGIAIALHLAASPTFLAIASPMSEMLWQHRGRGAIAGRLGTWHSGDRTGLSFFEDIDLHGSRLAILGLMRAHDGMSRDGAIAWTADLGKSPVELRPLAYAVAGKGARPFDACSTFEIGRVRFLADGRLLLVPGAEPGIQLFSPAGHLLRTWDTARMGVDVRCNFGEKQMLQFAADDDARMRYLSKLTYVDEVFATTHGPAVLVKRPEPPGRRWTLYLLGDDGKVAEVAVPWALPSPNARIRGDIRGDRLILVATVYEPGRGDSRSKLIEARLAPKR
jgi:hypothetical protein